MQLYKATYPGAGIQSHTKEADGSIVLTYDERSFPTIGPIADDGTHTEPHVVQAPVGYQSEIATVLLGGAPQFEMRNGIIWDVLHNKAASTAIQAPMPPTWGTGTIHEQVGRLLQWQMDNPWMSQQLYIDGGATGQAGDTSRPLRFTTEGEKLRTADGYTVPPAPQVVTIPAPTASTSSGAQSGNIIDITGQTGQRLYRLGGGPYSITCRDMVANPGLGFVKIATQKGAETVPGSLSISGGNLAVEDATGALGTVYFSVGAHHPDEGLNFAAGASMVISGTCGEPILADIRMP